jgi:hypothetical protein
MGDHGYAPVTGGVKLTSTRPLLEIPEALVYTARQPSRSVTFCVTQCCTQPCNHERPWY